MQAQREKLASLSDCKDKFLVQSCIVPAGTPEASAELFDSRAPTDIKHTKLRVVLLGPPEPPSPVPEGVEEDGSPRGKEHIDAHHSGAPPAGCRRGPAAACQSPGDARCQS